MKKRKARKTIAVATGRLHYVTLLDAVYVTVQEWNHGPPMLKAEDVYKLEGKKVTLRIEKDTR